MLGSYVELLYFLFDFLVSPRKAGISRLIGGPNYRKGTGILLG